MSVLNVAAWALGIVFIVVGYARARPYLDRSARLREQEDNVRRYEEWRGRSGHVEQGPSSAELMAAELRRRAIPWLGLATAGIVVVLAGLLIR